MFAPLRSLNTAQPARLAATALTFAVWALLAGSALWWWLRAGGGAAAPEAPVAERAQADVNSAALARALGATGAANAPAAPARAAAANPNVRLTLSGVLTHGQDGAALVAVNGRVRPVRVGAPVGKDAEGWTLREALPHAVVLVGGDGRQMRLEMPGDEERKRLIKARAAQAPQGGRPAPAAPAPAPQAAPVQPPRAR